MTKISGTERGPKTTKTVAKFLGSEFRKQNLMTQTVAKNFLG